MSPAVFNWFAVVIAVVIGIAAGMSARRVLIAGRGEWAAIVTATVVGAVLSAGATAATTIVSAGDFFAVTHLVYLVAAVGVPASGAIVMIGRHAMSPWLRGVAGVLLVPVPLGVYATHVEPFWLRTERVVLSSEGVGDVPIRVGVLSDLQTTEVGDYERDAVDRLLAERPDVVLIPGDLYHVEHDLDRVASGFAALLERLGSEVPHVLAVSGNTDSVAGLRTLAADTGVVVLDNEFVDVSVGETTIRVLGVTLDGDEQRLSTALAAANGPALTGTEPIMVVLAHQPDEVFRFGGVGASTAPDLLVAGHTHGGQIALPGIGPLVTLSSVPRSVAGGGLGEVGGVPVYVSTGVGRERGYAPQIRLGVRPSIGIIDLVARRAG